MKKWFTHKHQAFYLSCFIFLPLLLFAVFNDIFKVQLKGEDKISLVMSQFIAQGRSIQSSSNPEPAPMPPEPIKHIKKPKEARKKIKPQDQIRDKKAKQFKKIEEVQAQNSPPPGGAQIDNNKPTQIGTLAFGKNDNPFLREIKKAIDEAARESYPRQARRMKLMGEVLLEFVWLYSKELGEIKIVKSSGHEILDKNVYKIIAKASKSFPQYKEDVKIRIPIVYNIQ